MIEVLIVLAALVLALLLVPIGFSTRIRFPEAMEVHFRLAGGLLQWHSTPDGQEARIAGFALRPGREPTARQTTAPAREAASTVKIVKQSAKKIWRILGQTEVLRLWARAFRRSMRSIFASVRFKSFFMDLLIGLETPAQTGVLLGSWYALEPALSAFAPPCVSLSLRPEFAEKRVSGEIQIEGHTALWRLLRPILILLYHAPLWRTQKLIRSIES